MNRINKWNLSKHETENSQGKKKLYIESGHHFIAALISTFLELSYNGNGYKGLTLEGDA